ncbi:hypothetical protein B566_EDAN001376 [Ephemera danica]|nr:hypothetical protein B566_EDAN001376 [Ephemera danica]
MSWFGEGLSNLKGQITNFTKEVLAEAAAENSDLSPDQLQLLDAKKQLSELQTACSAKDLEISRLQQRAQELEARLKLPQHSASSPNVLQPHLSAAALAAGPSSAGSAVEEEQDGWSQFSEEDFPCLNETATASTPTAVVSKDDDRAVLRARLQDAEARLHELELRPAEDQQGSVSGLQLSCQQLLKQIVSFDEKGEGDTEARTQALEQLVSLLHRRPEDVASRTKLEEECGRLREKLVTSEKKAESLKSKVESVKEENVTLTRSLEELDEQNQAALERLMALKTSLTEEKEQLVGQLAAAHSEAQQELENRLSQLEEDLRTSLSQSLPESIAQEVGDADSAAVLGRAVARQCADLLWKKEASERKLAEVTREVRDLRQELTTARSEAAKLRDHSERLMGQLSVAAPSTSGALEPIPEDREEESEVTFEDVTETPEAPSSHSNQSVESLQREAEALREARENLEAEVNSLRSTNEGLATRMRSMGAELRNQENLQREATSFSVQVSELRQQLQDAVGHNETLSQELLSTQRQMRELQEKCDVLVKQEEELKLGKNSTVEILRDKEISEQAMQQEVQKLKQELEQEVLNNSNSQILLSDLQQQVKQLQDCSSDVTNLQQKLQSLETTSSKLQSENDSLKQKLEQEILNNNNSQILLSTLQQQVKELQESSSDVTNLEQKLQSLEVNSSEIQSENESLKQECTTLKQQIKEKASDNSSLFFQLQEAFMNMECMHHESTLDGQSIKNYVEKVKMLVQSNSDLQLECQKLHEQLKSVEMVSESKNKEVEKDVEQKTKLDIECRRLQLEVEDALAEKLQLQEILAQQSSQINELQSRLESESKTYECLIEQEKNSYKELAAKFSDMEKSYQDVVNVAESLQQETQKLKAETELVMNKTEDDDALIKRLESEISEWRNKAVNIEESYQMSSQGYQEIVKAMEAKEKVARKLETDMESLNQEVEGLTESLNLKCIECSTLEDNISLLEQQQQKLTVINSKQSAELEEKNKQHSELKTSLVAAENQKSELSTQLHNLNISLTEEKQRLESEITKSLRLSEEFEKLQNAKESIIADNQQLKEELQSSLQKLASFESARLNEKTTDTDNAALKILQAEFDAVQKQSQSLEEQCASLKQQISDSEMIKHQLSVVQVERANILGVLDEKTRENASLRSENHRLMGLVATEKATSQQLLQEKTELLSRKEFQSSEASEMARESVASLAKIIRDKDQELETLKSKNQSLLTLMQDSNPGLAIHQLFSQHPDVELLKKEVGQLQQEKSQLVQSLQLKHQESLQYHAEIQRLTMALTERPSMELTSGGNANLEQLMQNLSQEQQRNKFLQNEVQELSEKESALQGELGRLRQHLVSVEEQYTEEALRGEQMTQELRSQLAAAEERARNTVTSLSSASARAGQQVELLQEQARVATVQRDDALRRLTIAEDEGQLQEAKEGLSAAARLGVQMDKKSEQIASLKDEVAKLNEQLNQAQQQINSASQSMEGKVDKYLIKNLIVGYFMTAPNNRQEALRIVATVLDFSREERARSLAEAFIRFLENESRPVPQVRMLEEAMGRQRKDSPAPARSPLLMDDMVLPSFAPVPTIPSASSPASSSSSLKDVLRDS